MSRPTMRALWIALALSAGTAAVFAEVRGFEFVSWDDPWYVVRNPHVTGGLSRPGLAWAFTSSGGFYWHPLTWLSHMLDVSLFGMNAGAHHLVNLLIHVVNVLLLFAVLRQLTSATWRSALVAALFAVHPLRVESVAWVAERKDVLSTCCWMVTIAAYAWYARRPGWKRYAAVTAAFALGLMAKPMIVTLPVVLLLLDVWPLGRWPLVGVQARRAWGQLVAEKLPLFALALAAAAATFVFQRQAGAVGGLDAVSVYYRVGNAAIAYWVYLVKTIWPVNLAAFYPYPAEAPRLWLVGLAGFGLAVVMAAALKTIHSRPYVFVGAAWYFVTLLPVTGLFQAGDQLMADRFSYVPLIGVFIVIAWGAGELAALRPRMRPVLTVAAAAAVLACAAAAHAQVGYWKNSETLWTRALAVTSGNHRAHAGLGDLLAARGSMDEAVRHYREAVRLAPGGPDYRYGLGMLLLRQGRFAEAGAELSLAVKLSPNDAAARLGLGFALARAGDDAAAADAFAEAARLDPGSEIACINLGVALSRLGRTAEAIDAFERALRINPASERVKQALAELKRGGR